MGKIKWEKEEIDVTADDVLEGGAETKMDEAVAFLDGWLPTDGREVFANDIHKDAKKRGIKERTLKRAKRQMKVKSFGGPNIY